MKIIFLISTENNAPLIIIWEGIKEIALNKYDKESYQKFSIKYFLRINNYFTCNKENLK